MTTQSEALRLADALQQQAVWEGHYGPSYLRDLLPEAAAELRHLVSQRDALLEACKTLVQLPETEDWMQALHKAVNQARAAIKAAEENT